MLVTFVITSVAFLIVGLITGGVSAFILVRRQNSHEQVKLEAQIAEYQELNGELTAQVQRKTTLLAVANEKQLMAEATASEFKAKLIGAEQLLQQSSRFLNECREQVAGLTSNKESLQLEKQSLIAQLDKSRSECESLKVAVLEQATALSKSYADLKAANNNNEALKSQLGEQTTMNSELSEWLNRQQNKLSETTAKLEAKEVAMCWSQFTTNRRCQKGCLHELLA